MLTIRKEQVAVLDREMERQFELKMVAHLRQRFPKQTEEKEDEELVEDIRKGVKASSNYGITAECDVARYIEYMMIYGRDFDADPKTGWAGEILRGERISGPEKLDRIDDHNQLSRSKS